MRKEIFNVRSIEGTEKWLKLYKSTKNDAPNFN